MSSTEMTPQSKNKEVNRREDPNRLSNGLILFNPNLQSFGLLPAWAGLSAERTLPKNESQSYLPGGKQINVPLRSSLNPSLLNSDDIKSEDYNDEIEKALFKQQSLLESHPSLGNIRHMESGNLKTVNMGLRGSNLQNVASSSRKLLPMFQDSAEQDGRGQWPGTVQDSNFKAKRKETRAVLDNMSINA